MQELGNESRLTRERTDNRINAMFLRCKQKKKKAFIGYLTAGYPSIDDTKQYIYALQRGGADLIEIGIPYSDPLADGPVIQEVGKYALDHGVTLDQIFLMTKQVRMDTQIPLVYMVYINTILIYGIESFAKRCKEVGIDGLIVPDLPYEEREELKQVIDRYHIALIPLVAPTSLDRVSKIVKEGEGFVYCVSSLGVTGKKVFQYDKVIPYLSHVRELSSLPIAVGFGIACHEDISHLGNHADGVIVGSAIMEKIKESKGDTHELEAYVRALIHG